MDERVVLKTERIKIIIDEKCTNYIRSNKIYIYTSHYTPVHYAHIYNMYASHL